jgi:glutathione S-transferase
MELRPTYLGTKSDYFTHSHDLPPQLGGCEMTAEGESVSAIVDGQAGGSWQLPLPPLSGSSLPEPYSPGEDPQKDRLEAAAKMVGWAWRPSSGGRRGSRERRSREGLGLERGAS